MTPEEALELVGLGQRLDHFPSQLSGGEQQRVAIARAIAKRPDVLLCDEPTGALDVTTGIVVLEAIERVNRELGTTTAVITHNAVIADMADRVISLSDGRIARRRRENAHAAARARAAVVRRDDLARCSTASCSATSGRCKGQAVAIALVMAAGVAMLIVMSLSTFDSLQRDARRLLRALPLRRRLRARSSARRSRLAERIAAIPASRPSRRASSPTSRSTCRA